MTTKTRPALLLLLLAAVLASLAVAGCGSSDPSQADKAATLAAEQQKNPPKLTEPTTPKVTVVKVAPSAGEADISTKPVIPKQTGADPKTLIVQDLIVGTGAEAKSGDTVDVRYVGVLRSNGKEFDSSWSRGDQAVHLRARGRLGHRGLGQRRRRHEGRRSPPADHPGRARATARRARRRRSPRTPRSCSTSTSRRSRPPRARTRAGGRPALSAPAPAAGAAGWRAARPPTCARCARRSRRPLPGRRRCGGPAGSGRCRTGSPAGGGRRRCGGP